MRTIFKISDISKYPESYGPARRLHHGWHAEYAPKQPSFVAGLFSYYGINNDGWSDDGGKTWFQPGTPAGESKGMLPGMAVIGMYLLVFSMLNAFAAMKGVFGTGAVRYSILGVCTLMVLEIGRAHV